MHWGQRSTRPCGTLRAFTLVEVIIVIIILGLLASIAVPRFAPNNTRAFKLTIEEISDLLTMFAQRESLGQKVVGIYHNRSTNELHLLQIDRESAEETARWMPDPFVEPVKLPRFMTDSDIEIIVDGDWIDASEWPVSSEVGHHRPNIEIVMRGGDESARVILSPHAVAPIINTNLTMERGVTREKYDLDNAGRGREDW